MCELAAPVVVVLVVEAPPVQVMWGVLPLVPRSRLDGWSAGRVLVGSIGVLGWWLQLWCAVCQASFFPEFCP